MTRVLVIVVTYNGSRWLQSCLRSVAFQSVGAADEGSEWYIRSGSPVTVDAMIIDNASTDGTANYAKDHFPWVRIVESKENLGFGAANNIGLKSAMEEGYDYAYLLNQDAWILPGTLSALLSAAESDASFAVLSPRQMQPRLDKEDVLFSRIKRSGKGKVQLVSRVMAAHWLIRLSALRDTGLFAPIFRHYGEDDNLCARLRRNGHKIGVVPESMAVHDRVGRDITSPQARQRTWWIASLVLLCDPCRPLPLQWLHVAALTLVKTVKNRTLAPMKAFPRLVAMNKEIKETRRI